MMGVDQLQRQAVQVVRHSALSQLSRSDCCVTPVKPHRLPMVWYGMAWYIDRGHVMLGYSIVA